MRPFYPKARAFVVQRNFPRARSAVASTSTLRLPHFEPSHRRTSRKKSRYDSLSNTPSILGPFWSDARDILATTIASFGVQLRNGGSHLPSGLSTLSFSFGSQDPIPSASGFDDDTRTRLGDLHPVSHPALDDDDDSIRQHDGWGPTQQILVRPSSATANNFPKPRRF